MDASLAAPAPSRRAGGAERVLLGAVASAWALATAAQIAGAAAPLHHDGLIEGRLPLVLALGLSLAAWVLMVVAMMLPSSLPLITLFTHASRGQPHRRAALAAFLAGYGLVWLTFGAAAFLFDVVVHTGVDAWPWLGHHDWLIGGGVLVTAGAFQFTPLKYACLDSCRSPGAFLLRYYGRGRRAAMRLGARHGVFCVGCCWALMLVMFAVGVANLVWMAALTAVMVHEKTRPSGRDGVPVTGVALLGVASIVLASGAYSTSAG
jgi:predicted metal-binding membrane protein